MTFGAFLPAIRHDLQLNLTAAGMFSTINLAAYLAGTIGAPAAADRLGSNRAAVAGQAVVALGCGLCAIAGGVVLLAIGRLLMGAGAGVALVSILGAALRQTSHGSGPVVSALGWSGLGAAILATGAMLSLVADGQRYWRESLLIAAIASAGTGFALARVCWGELYASKASAADAVTGRGSEHRIPLITAYVMFGAGYISYSTFVGVQMQSSGMPAQAVGMVWSVLGGAAIIGCFLAALMLQQVHVRRFALAAALGAAAAGTALLAVRGSTVAVITAWLVGLGLASTPTVVTAYVRMRTSDRRYVREFSQATAWMGVSQLSAPAVAGALADAYGATAIVWFSAIAYALGAIAALIDAAKTKSDG